MVAIESVPATWIIVELPLQEYKRTSFIQQYEGNGQAYQHGQNSEWTSAKEKLYLQ